MSPAYIEAVTRHLPRATLVFDRFHVIKLYNEKLSDLRRTLYRELTDKLQKDSSRLEKALKLNEPLAIAYYLKEELNQVWEQDDELQAQALLMDWVAAEEGLMPHRRAARLYMT